MSTTGLVGQSNDLLVVVGNNWSRVNNGENKLTGMYLREVDFRTVKNPLTRFFVN